jgi:inorganic pyrophosphatase
VETPRLSRAKFVYDPESQTFAYGKELTWGLAYPTDWGFFPSTKALDGDPLDALVLHDLPTFPGLVIPCRIVGVLSVRDREHRQAVRNDRIIVVPAESNRCKRIKDINDVSADTQEELAYFFSASVREADKAQTYWDGTAARKPFAFSPSQVGGSLRGQLNPFGPRPMFGGGREPELRAFALP